MLKLTQEQKEILEAQINVAIILANKMRNVQNGYSRSALQLACMLDHAEVEEDQAEELMAA